MEDLPSKWEVFAAILSDKGNRRGYVKFVDYHARLKGSDYDPSKPLEEQLEIEENKKPVLDLYARTGNVETDTMPTRMLRKLVKELEERYELRPANSERSSKEQ